MAQTVMPNVLTDEQINSFSGGMPDTLTDDEINSFGAPTPLKKPSSFNVGGFLTRGEALFPANETPSRKEGIFKTAANVVPDFAQSVARFPYDLVKTLVKDIPQEAKGLIQESGGVGGAVKNLFKSTTQLPQSAYRGLVPNAIQKTVSGDFTGAGKEIIEHPFREVGPLVGGVEALKRGTISKIASPVLKTTGTISEGAKTGLKTLENNRTQKAISGLENAYRDVAGQTQKPTKLLRRAEVRGKDPIGFLSERGIVPTVEDGKVRTFDKVVKLRESANPLNEHLDLALEEIQPSIPKTPIETVRQRAINGINRLDNITESTRESMLKDVNTEFDLLKGKYGETFTLKQINNIIKKPAWADTKFDSTKPYKSDVNYQIGKAAKQTIESSVPKEAVDVQELNRYIGDVYEASKFLESLDGRVVKGGRLGKYSARIGGSIVGSAFGGGFGSLVGYLGGELVSDLLQRNTFSGPLRNRILQNLAVKDPAAYTQALEFLKKAGMERQSRLMLTAPNYIELGPRKFKEGKPVLTPAQRGLLGKSPKTGRFFRSFRND